MSGHSKDVQIACRLLQVDDGDDSESGDLNNALVGRALKRLVVYRVYDVLSFILNPSSVNTIPMASKSTVSGPSLESLVRICIRSLKLTIKISLGVYATQKMAQRC